MRFLVLLLFPLFLAAPVRAEKDVRDQVPRQVQLSVGTDHLFGVLQLRVRPADLGRSSWGELDSDGNGSLDDEEMAVLLEEIRARETASLCVAVGGGVLDFGGWPLRRTEPQTGAVPLDAAVALKVEGRVDLALAAGEHSFLFYDLPSSMDGIVPVSLRLTPGTALVGASGARAEARSPSRLEGVLTRFNPALWGTLRRDP
ncbi:MAG: hypothetical protein VX498_05390 [Myxococcota bacterium]|nr:hypothetical protein [Myxococcota bacterium]